MKDKRLRIINAALKVFAEHGLISPPVPSITREAGVATGTLYSYFKSKDDLINVLYDEVEMQLVEFIKDQSVTSHLTTEEKIKGLIARLLSFFLEDKNRFFFFIHFHNSQKGGDYRKKRGQIPGDLGYYLSSIIQKGIDEGSIVDIPIDIHFKFCVEVLLSIVRDHYLSVQHLDQQILNQIPVTCWNAIKK